MAVYDYTPLYGAGDIIPGTTASIFQNLGIANPNVPVFELLGSANKGGSNVNERMTFAAQPGQSYRLVNKATGDVLGEASTPEGISALVEQSNALSKSLGKKADIAFEQSNPEVFGGGYTQMFQDQPDEVVGGFLGNVMDVGIPLLSSLVVPGAGFLGTILPAAAGSAASSAMQGRGLEETLLRAALSGAGAGVGEKFLAPAIDTAFKPATQALSQTGAQAVTQTGTQAGTQAVAGGASDIIVNALPSLASRGLSTGITSLATSLLPSPFDSAQLSDVAPSQPAQVEQPLEAGPEIVATAQTGAQIPTIPPLIPDVAPLEQFTPIDEVLKGVDMGPEKQGLLKSLMAKMGPTDYLTAASLLGSAVAGGGGGGAGTTAGPYVSPFGAGVGFGAGQDMRVNPNIADYERYAFGPEATFFAPGYSQLVSGAAGAPMQAPTTMGPRGAMVNPQYVPLI